MVQLYLLDNQFSFINIYILLFLHLFFIPQVPAYNNFHWLGELRLFTQDNDSVRLINI